MQSQQSHQVAVFPPIPLQSHQRRCNTIASLQSHQYRCNPIKTVSNPPAFCNSRSHCGLYVWLRAQFVQVRNKSCHKSVSGRGNELLKSAPERHTVPFPLCHGLSPLRGGAEVTWCAVSMVRCGAVLQRPTQKRRQALTLKRLRLTRNLRLTLRRRAKSTAKSKTKAKGLTLRLNVRLSLRQSLRLSLRQSIRLSLSLRLRPRIRPGLGLREGIYLTCWASLHG